MMRWCMQLILCAISLVSIVGCSNQNVYKDVDSGKLAEQLLDTIKDDELTKLSSDLIESVYGIQENDYAEAEVYVSTGATAMEIAIFKGKEKKEITEIAKILEERNKEQLEIYQTYAPEEVIKLQNYIKKEYGNYVIYCVVEDYEKVNTIIEETIQ